MSDLISRQDAIDGFYNVKVHEEDCTEYDIGYNDGIDYAISKISVLPSAEPDLSEWMPVKDALPAKTGKYLVTVRNGNVYAASYDTYSKSFHCAAVAWMSSRSRMEVMGNEAGFQRRQSILQPGRPYLPVEGNEPLWASGGVRCRSRDVFEISETRADVFGACVRAYVRKTGRRHE